MGAHGAPGRANNIERLVKICCSIQFRAFIPAAPFLPVLPQQVFWNYHRTKIQIDIALLIDCAFCAGEPHALGLLLAEMHAS